MILTGNPVLQSQNMRLPRMFTLPGNNSNRKMLIYVILSLYRTTCKSSVKLVIYKMLVTHNPFLHATVTTVFH